MIYIKTDQLFRDHNNINRNKSEGVLVHITGLLIHADLERAAGIQAHLAGLPGVEVHAITGDGRLIVTVEAGSEHEMTRAFEQLGAIPGVRATTLVYHHAEPLDHESLAEKESSP